MIFILLLLITSAAAMSNNVDEDKAREMYNCFHAVLCNARKPYEFRRVMEKADDELITRGFQWMREICGFKNASDTPQFWDSYPDLKCPLSEETKEKYFFAWIQKLGEYWAECCADNDPENPGVKCVKMEEAENEFNMVMAEYTAKGVCSSKTSEVGKENFEEGKAGMDDMKNKQPPMMMG